MRKIQVLFLSFALTSIAQAADNASWRISVGGGLSLSSTSKGDLDYSTLSTGAFLLSGEVEVKEKISPHIELDIRRTPKNSWGGMFGVSYDFKHKLKEMTLKIAGHSNTATANGNDEIQTTSFYANAVYRWNNFYIPFGLNYTLLDLTTKDEGVELDGGIGVQLGVGYWFTNSILAEFFIRAYNTELKVTSPTDDLVAESDELINTSTRLTIKYVF